MPLSLGARQLFFTPVDAAFEAALHFAVVPAHLYRVVMELRRQFAANGPQPFQPVIMLRFHLRPRKVPAADRSDG